MSRAGPLLRREINQAARAAIQAVTHAGLHCCLFGSTACAFYGMENRVPNDVDLVVMNVDDFGYDAEDIKHILVRRDRRFYLVDARTPGATYQVLYFRLGGLNSTRRCKIDVLVPGLLSIPKLVDQEFTYIENQPAFPLMPLMTLIVLKLRGWWDHLNDDRYWMREKVEQDEGDIEEMLDLAWGYGCSVWEENLWWDEAFIEEALGWVDEFVDACPHTEGIWAELGFDDLRG